LAGLYVIAVFGLSKPPEDKFRRGLARAHSAVAIVSPPRMVAELGGLFSLGGMQIGPLSRIHRCRNAYRDFLICPSFGVFSAAVAETTAGNRAQSFK